MIANALRVEIERYAARMKRSNPLFWKAEDGTFTSECMVNYLTNVRHLVWHGQLYIGRAGERALAVGDAALAKHYQHKRREEAGHEAWADRDIQRVSAASMGPVNPDVLPSVHGLVAFLATTIDVEEALDQIDALVGDPRKLPRMRAVLLDVLAYFDRFCAEVTEERHETWVSPDVERHVSAA